MRDAACLSLSKFFYTVVLVLHALIIEKVIDLIHIFYMLLLPRSAATRIPREQLMTSVFVQQLVKFRLRRCRILETVLQLVVHRSFYWQDRLSRIDLICKPIHTYPAFFYCI